MKLTGKIIETIPFEKGDFYKTEVVLAVADGAYTQEIPIEFVKDNADHVKDLSIGDEITVSFNIKGRKWNDRRFLSLDGWKVEDVKPVIEEAVVLPNDNVVLPSDNEPDDILPF